MTDENPGSSEVPQETGDSDSTAVPSSPGSSLMQSGQGMVTLGCWIIVGIYLITGVVMNEYWIAWLALIPAIAILILGRVHSKTATAIAPHATLIKVLAYLIVVVAVLDLIEDLRFASTAFDEFIDIVGSLAFWGAAALCFFGARSISD